MKHGGAMSDASVAGRPGKAGAEPGATLVDVGPALERCVAALWPIAERSGVTIEAAAEPGLFSRVYIERGQLERVLFDLVGHAMTHAACGARRVSVRLKASLSELTLSVYSKGLRELGSPDERGLKMARLIVEARGGRF